MRVRGSGPKGIDDLCFDPDRDMGLDSRLGDIVPETGFRASSLGFGLCGWDLSKEDRI